jgi:hypothetical protein
MEKFSSHQAKKKFIVALGIVSFALQYVWENLQYGPFFNASTTYMAVGMFIAALGDVAMTFIVYVIISVVSGSWKWPLKIWKRNQWILMIIIALISSISFEFLAKIFKIWSYTRLALIIPGLEISVIPVLQFLILFPLSFLLTRYILK